MERSSSSDDLLGSRTLVAKDYEYHETFRGRFFSTRFRLVFMGFLGFFLVYSMRVNISVALVDMTLKDTSDDNQTINENCPDRDSNSSSNDGDDGTFDWSTTQQANVLGAFYYGYMVTQIPAGYLASKHGAKHLFGLGVFFTGVLTIFTPPVSYLGVNWLIFLRVLEGVAEAATFPAFSHLVSRWSPKNERSMMAALSVSGSSFGNMATQPIIGYLCTLDLWNGWPLGFYCNGLLAIIWYVAWCLTVFDSPDKHPRISESEKQFIKQNSQVDETKSHVIPWKGIFTSLPFYGILIANFCSVFINYGLMSFLPQFLSNVLNFDIATNGFLSALPWLSCFLGAIFTSQITDFLLSRKYVSTTFIRKFNQLGSSVLSGLFLVLAGYAGCDATLAVVCISVGLMFYGMNYCGFYCNNIDIAPQFAGVIFGITNTLATTSGFLAPIMVNKITEDNIHSSELWLHAFYAFAAIAWFGGFAFLLLASGNLQPWAITEDMLKVETLINAND